MTKDRWIKVLESKPRKLSLEELDKLTETFSKYKIKYVWGFGNIKEVKV